MDGVTLLQAVPGPGTINPVSVFFCILLGIMGLILMIITIMAFFDREDGLILLVIPTIILITGSLIAGFQAHNNRLISENYYYVTIENHVTMNEFFEHYDLIKHEPNSSLWLVKEKNNNMEENENANHHS